MLSYIITEPGYVYIYLSNDNLALRGQQVEVYFDDFEVLQAKSPVIQADNYYPFGLAFNSYNRENSVPQDYKYNSKEEQTELSLGWLDYGARMYQPELGRFFTQDRFAEKYFDFTPYQYGANSPMNFVDINGDSLAIPMSGQATIDSMDDLMFLVAGTGVGISAIESNVTLNFGDMTEEQIAELKNNNEGVKLLTDLISAGENYLYESSTTERAKNRETGEILHSEQNPAYGDPIYSIRNTSDTPRNIDRGIGPADFAVGVPGYNGHVRIGPGSYTQMIPNADGTKTEQSVQRASVIFHELSENYARTTLKMPYERKIGSGAHRYAIKREGSAYGNSHPGKVHHFYPKR